MLQASRRATLALPFLGLAVTSPAEAGQRPTPGIWPIFKRRFLTDDGRIIDRDNGGVSHSEGQAWGMLLAVIHDDRGSFDRILDWTQRNLAIRGDRLLAWRYNPSLTAPVLDLNSATDGDLFYAWALLRAADRWQSPAYHALARGVASDILRFAARRMDGRIILLPGAWGFEHPNHIVINPSYYVFPALEALAAAFPRPEWQGLIVEGERVLQQARFGRWELPADWVTLDRRNNMLRPEPQRGVRFGFDAVRIPLYLAWSGRWQSPVMAHANNFWSYSGHPYMPAWVEVTSNRIAPFAATLGTVAIGRLVDPRAQGAAPTQRVILAAADSGYYDFTLTLLADAARQEAPPAARFAT